MASPAKGPIRFISTGQFGVGDVAWIIRPEDKPNEVAAAVLHHELLRRLRQLHSGRLTASALAAATGASERTTLRLLHGESDASIVDLVAWAAASGPALFNQLSIDLTALLPTEAPKLIPNWQTGQWRPPRFVTEAGPLDIDFGSITTRIADFLATEEARGRARLVTVEVIRHLVATALTEAGVPAGELSIDATLEDSTVYELVVDLDPETVAISFACTLTAGPDRGALRSATASVIGALRKVAVAPADRRTVVIVARGAVADRLERIWLGCTGEPGDTVTLTFSDIRNYVEPGAEPFDVRGRLVGRSASSAFFVAVADLSKPDSPTT